MTRNDDPRVRRRGTAVLATLAGILLTAGVASAQVYEDDDGDTTYESAFADNDAELYGYYNAGFDQANDNDDWFFDYYELGPTAGEQYWGTQYELDDGLEYEDRDALDLDVGPPRDQGQFED